MTEQGQRRFTTIRSVCPVCHSKRGWAGDIDSSNPQQYGYCHACNASRYEETAGKQNPYKKHHTTVKVNSVKVDSHVLLDTGGTTSPLHTFLIRRMGEPMKRHLQQWNVGTDAEKRTLWHYIDYHGDHVTTKAMDYDGSTGKRNKNAPPLFGLRLPDGRKIFLAKADGYRACLYGECYLKNGIGFINYQTGEVATYYQDTPVFLVESEKSAVLASFLLPQFVWIATGGVSGLTEAKATHLHGRKVTILFDADTAGQTATENTAALLGRLGVKVKKLFPSEVFGLDAKDGYDVGDYVLQHYNEYNEDTERLAIVEESLRGKA